MANPTVEKDVCIAGGGPAGLLLGLLLARLGVRVLVLEQHRDFSREYRGEVLMPRFTQLFQTLGLFELLEKQPHLKLSGAELIYKDRQIGRISFDRLVPETPFALWMPQPILLSALHEEAGKFPSFEFWFDASAKSLVREGAKTVGLEVLRDQQAIEVRAKITVGADGRFSAIRRAGGFKVAYQDHHFDIIWFTIPKPEGYENLLRFFLSGARNLLALPKYPDSIQCGLVVDKGEYAQYRRQGLESIRKILLGCHPLVHDFARGLRDWNEFNVLQAELDLVQNWEQDGLLLIGDAAHTMSPVGAVGVAIAVETAAVAAGIIYRALERNDFSAKALDQVQAIREPVIREIHRIQKTFSGTLLARNPILHAARPVLIPLIIHSPFSRPFQRRLAALDPPLPLAPEILSLQHSP